jgi:hypothetical protein
VTHPPPAQVCSIRARGLRVPTKRSTTSRQGSQAQATVRHFHLHLVVGAPSTMSFISPSTIFRTGAGLSEFENCTAWRMKRLYIVTLTTMVALSRTQTHSPSCRWDLLLCIRLTRSAFPSVSSSACGPDTLDHVLVDRRFVPHLQRSSAPRHLGPCCKPIAAHAKCAGSYLEVRGPVDHHWNGHVLRKYLCIGAGKRKSRKGARPGDTTRRSAYDCWVSSLLCPPSSGLER